MALVAAAVMASAPAAQAQVQRSFISLGFEEPVLPASCGSETNSAVIPAADIPGWETTHVPMDPWCRVGGTGSGLYPLIDVWKSGRVNGIPARSGNQMAELNALRESRIFQTVCLLPGDQVRYRLGHRARQAMGDLPGGDTMIFKIGTDSGADFIDLLTARTDHNGVSTNHCHTGLPTHQCEPPQQVGVWTDYSCAFNWQEAAGNYQFGFEAMDTSGDRGFGNAE